MGRFVWRKIFKVVVVAVAKEIERGSRRRLKRYGGVVEIGTELRLDDKSHTRPQIGPIKLHKNHNKRESRPSTAPFAFLCDVTVCGDKIVIFKIFCAKLLHVQ